MSAKGHASNWRLTPKNRFLSGKSMSPALAKPDREESGLQLTLKAVFGTTTASADGFDTDPRSNVFVCCAGPAAILSRVDTQLNITQQLYRARHDAAPVNAIPSFYNPSTPPNTPRKSHHPSPLKESTYGQGSARSLDVIPGSPGHGSTRNREVTCVALSPRANILAIGETGYNPRVLLFSTSLDAPSDIPLSSLTDHTFGVSSIAFSDDSRWLCTLGNRHDGFILIYQMNVSSGSARLHSSNKCSNVNSVTWMGSSVISIGTRHVKLWRLDRAGSTSPSKTRCESDVDTRVLPGSPMPKTFSGRNCLLGDLIDATFSTAIAISDCKAIVCTDRGDICLLDDTDRNQRLEKIAKANFGISCVALDQTKSRVWITGEKGVMNSIQLSVLIEPTASESSSVTSILEPVSLPQQDTSSSNVAIGMVRDRIISIDSNRTTNILAVEDGDTTPLALTVVKTLPAHESAVLGVRSLLPKARDDDPDFLTYSARGVVLYWTLKGVCTDRVDVLLEQPSNDEDGAVNELKVVASSESSRFLVSGDKYGVLGRFDRRIKKLSSVQAHSGDINGIAIAETGDTAMVASCGRDRTLQIFRDNARDNESVLELLQTMDDHAATVTNLGFLNGASILISISSDRSVIVRRQASGSGTSVAYLAVRVITLKSSPVSFTSVPDEPNWIVVSTTDKQIQRYDLASGRLLHISRGWDPETNETVAMSSLEVHTFEHAGTQVRLLLGVSSNDKAIRIHDYDTSSMLSKENGQTAVSAVKLIREPIEHGLWRTYVVSSSLDGTVMIWDLSSTRSLTETSSESCDVQGSPMKQTPTSHRPLRRVLSKAEMSRLQSSLESESDTVTPMRSSPPSRALRRPSRSSLAAAAKPSAGSHHSVNGMFDRKISSGHTSPSLRSHDSSRVMRKRPSLDHRRRSKSATNLRDLNSEAEHLCKSLRVFRKAMTSLEIDSIDARLAQDLQDELTLTLGALTEKAGNRDVGHEIITSDMLDRRLASMIDERLALKASSDDTRKDDHKDIGRSGGEGPNTTLACAHNSD